MFYRSESTVACDDINFSDLSLSLLNGIQKSYWQQKKIYIKDTTMTVIRIYHVVTILWCLCCEVFVEFFPFISRFLWILLFISRFFVIFYTVQCKIYLWCTIYFINVKVIAWAEYNIKFIFLSFHIFCLVIVFEAIIIFKF